MLLASTEEGVEPSVTDQLVAKYVLGKEVEQLEWAKTELTKCIRVLTEGYQSMEDYIAAHYPGFFASPDAQQPPATLKALKARCRQTARSLVALIRSKC